MVAPNTWFTFRADDIWMGEFQLPPGAPAWDRTNQISELAPLIAIPRTAVVIGQEGRSEIVSDPTRAVLYAAGQPYQRRVVSADGDHCSFLTFSKRLAAEAAEPYDSTADDPDRYAFPFVVAPINAENYVEHQRLRARVARGEAEADEILEHLYGLVVSIVANGYRAAGVRSSSRADTAWHHAEIVEAVRGAIGRDLGVTASLEELGATVHLSPFHLSRIFRSVTGSSIHEYRTQVRLRASLPRLADGARLADLAADLGFSSQAHFTDRFREALGTTPHAWRSALSGPGGQKNRTKVESIGGVSHVA